MKRMLPLITTIILGLIAGLFYCWSISVTRGLARLSDEEYIIVFRQLNKAILNPLFFLIFMGPVLLLPLCIWRYFQQPYWWLLAIATLFYFIGVMGVTMGGNVPLNNALSESVIIRKTFEQQWNMLNNIRSCCSITSFAITCVYLKCTC